MVSKSLGVCQLLASPVGTDSLYRNNDSGRITKLYVGIEDDTCKSEKLYNYRDFIAFVS